MDSSNNPLESMNEDQQMMVFNLMAMANIEDVAFAAQMLQECNFDVNRAAQKLIDIQNGVSQPTPSNNTQQVSSNPPQPRPNTNNRNELAEKYKKHIEIKAKKEDESGIGDMVKSGVNGVFTKINKAWNFIIPTKIRGETEGGEKFNTFFGEHYSQLASKLKFNNGTFEENVEKSNDKKRPLLVYIHVDGSVFKSIPTKVFNNDKLQKLMNEKFHLLGLLANSAGSQSAIKFVETKNCPCLAVFRVNILDETKLIDFVSLGNESEPEGVYEVLKNLEGTYYMIFTDEDKVKVRVKNELENQRRQNLMMNNPFHQYYGDDMDEHGPMFQQFGGGGQSQRRQQTPEEIAALEEDRMLRQLQEQEYQAVENQYREQQQKQAEEVKQQQEEAEKKAQEERQRVEEQKRQDEEKAMAQQKAAQALPDEPSEGTQGIILIIFRLPNGDRVQRRFLQTDKAELLYTYVHSKDLKFEGDTGQWDLMQPRPLLVLDNKDKSIGEYFEGSDNEVITVREL